MLSPYFDLFPRHRIVADDSSSVIRITLEGFFDMETLKAHFSQSERVVARWRSLGKPILVLIDAKKMRPNAREGQEYVESETARIYQRGDRVATIVHSNLVKLQMRRVLTGRDVADFFVTEEEALDWLHA